MRNKVELIPVQGLPSINPGDNLPLIISQALEQNNLTLNQNDILVIAHKIVSISEKRLVNIQEVKARGGRLIAIVTKGDELVKELADYCIEIPNVPEEISPLLTNIPLQLLSYHIALLRGCNVDQPRNLAKSVTVE